ncbi:hypothetical protein NF27_EY00480 [Candidatus Jidaibacter acanthamoeba]|uniref:Uncharacterized protein n=1 Tax=Candidatus Jidaibacter acanthamoebae TaxID=86105 RepID=A0A0C1MSC5_9RICK|nr:hypothetical protein [Candidatus Jidaibacter acanthamoeba]KIE04952.1 hypothetical protein NF27_EY00480 [Candidatus Jidaibacter acanthamoeba]
MSKSSLWDFNSNVNTQFNTFDTDIIVGTLIIGVGITGITSAKLDNQARFNPLKYLNLLAVWDGIYTRTHLV